MASPREKPRLGESCLYLVTDSDLLHKSSASLESHVEEAVLGGVSVVQLREKTADTGDFLRLAERLLAVCRKHAVPLLVNDRVDVALAVGADGVHLGQDDMPCTTARRLLGDTAIIGVSVNTAAEARQAVQDGADYVGIGAVYDTQTKALTKPTLGVAGVREILLALADEEGKCGRSARVEAVAIGGINAGNIDRVVYASAAVLPSPAGNDVGGADGSRAGSRRALDGIALVSAIMASPTPRRSAQVLKSQLAGALLSPSFLPPNCGAAFVTPTSVSLSDLQTSIAPCVAAIRQQGPLVHQCTNNVVKMLSANVTLSVGASPVMSEIAAEASDLAAVSAAFLLNMGMIASDLTNLLHIAQAHNAARSVCVLDPVGAGASIYRRQATATLLDRVAWTVVKGNVGEICAAAGRPEGAMRGVDSTATVPLDVVAAVAGEAARKWRCVVVVTGVTDVVSDGVNTVAVDGGHAVLGDVTGTGCSLGSLLGAICASVKAEEGGVLAGAVAGCLLYAIAAETAVAELQQQGREVAPGSFVPLFIDALYKHTKTGLPAELDLGRRIRLL